MIPEERAVHYRLHEVIGTVVKLTAAIYDPMIPEEQFMELMPRQMSQDEKPLYIQNLSQVKDGYVRRFELRQLPKTTIQENLHRRTLSAGLQRVCSADNVI
jgi:hypothetical protein